MCQLFAHQPQRDYESQTRSLRIDGHCTTIRNALIISTARTRIGVVQIAGLVARRIVPFVREGQAIIAGDRIGMIRFGSRLDVYLPEGGRSLVAEGQTAIAGETVLADLAQTDAGRSYRIG